MKFTNKKLIASIMLPLVLSLGACASHLIDVRSGSERVSVADANQVSSCESKGRLMGSVLTEVGLFTRSVEAVEANLLQLALNGAVDKGGDTVVKKDTTRYGERTFDIYKCRP
ncbi:MAG: DUF4156 domain-containing protein [Nitrosomonadaceae bacterium]|jgi:hypothetical protein|nr:DUF4156 domain-containing protein [Nitrosospira sp.]MDW7565058.1 DUF4156 domain-containing protein [Nitrosomonadaceae bacterium]MBI0408533.1 DUF4156 domain-containing protein [Nitrosospira sp.]MBI0410177.1 DUF4156 domain-containing protein [Nitrosospira sp.]MBI0412424.1 DUF4156 domain-containing protein [Nitrosospira sp.]